MPFSDSNSTDVNDNAKVVVTGQDGVHGADVVLDEGVKRLQVGGTVSATVESLFGKVVYPYTYFEVDAIGDNGDTVRVQIPDDSVDVTYTKVAADVDTNELAKSIADELNDDSTFAALYKAIASSPILASSI